MRRLLAVALLVLSGTATAAPMARMGLAPLQAPVGSPLVAAPVRVSLAPASIPLLPASSIPGALNPSAPSLAPALRPDALMPSAPALIPSADQTQMLVPLGDAIPQAARDGALPRAALPSLERLAERLAKPEADQASLSGRFFDNGTPRGPPASGEQSAGRARRLPPGVASVEVNEAATPADIDALIPSGINSDELKAELKGKIGRVGPIAIHTFRDRKGGSFTGIDLSQRPTLVDHIPELQPHEKVLIKKLQLVTRDIQVLVREDGKTPDLVMAGRVTELKSLIGKEVSLEFLVNKANKQVVEHSKRHGLGRGDAALDLTEHDKIPVDEVLGMLNGWQAKTREVMLDQVWVFARADRKLMRRGADGLFRLADPGAAAPAAVASVRGGRGAQMSARHPRRSAYRPESGSLKVSIGELVRARRR